MRYFLSFVLLLVAGTCTLAKVDAAESPAEFVERFCKAEDAWGIRGLPWTQHEKLYDSFLGIELIRAIRGANSRLEDWKHRYRHSKENLMIPHIESNLFSGFSEGPTSCRIGRTIKTPSGPAVEIHREYREGKDVYQWVDRVLLDRDRDGWVVKDMDCHYGGSLLASIRGFRDSILAGDETAGR